MNFLSQELIKDLDCSINNDDINDDLNENKNKDENMTKTNIINSLISLAKDGYEFKPKNYKPEKINSKEQENNFSEVKREEYFNKDNCIVLSNCIKNFSFFIVKMFKLFEIFLNWEDKLILQKEDNIWLTDSKTFIIWNIL